MDLFYFLVGHPWSAAFALTLIAGAFMVGHAFGRSETRRLWDKADAARDRAEALDKRAWHPNKAWRE